jgi:hypothetical protein
MMVDFCWMLQRDVPKKNIQQAINYKKFPHKALKMPFSYRIKNVVRLLTKNYYKHLNFLNKLLNFFLLIVKKPDVIQKNELYFCNQGSNVIQNQLSKSKHRLKSFVLKACVICQFSFLQLKI